MQITSKNLARSVLPLLFLFCLLAPIACAAQVIQLYNPGRDLASQQIRSNFTKIDLVGVFKMQETNLASIATLEQGTLETLAVMKRDAILFDIIQAPEMRKTFFIDLVSTRLNELVQNLPSSKIDYLTNDIVNDLQFHTHFDDLTWQTLDFQAEYGIAPPPFQYQATSFPTMDEWFNGASQFNPDDIGDLKSLVLRFISPAMKDAVSPYLKASLAPATTSLFTQVPKAADAVLRKALADDFNNMVSGGSIYNAPAFAGIKLSPETSKLMGQTPVGADVKRLNILLILDACPEIDKERFQKHTPSRNGNRPAAYTLYTQVYDSLIADIATIVGDSGALPDALRGVFDAETKLAADQIAENQAANDYNQAVISYNVASTNLALATTTSDTAKLLAEVNKAMGSVNDNLQKLANSGGLFGRLTAITNELAAIDVVIGATASTNGASVGAQIRDPNVKRAAEIAAILPGILDKTVSLVQAVKRPPLMALLIDRDILLVQKDMAQKAIDRQKQAVLLNQQLFQAMLSEVNLLKGILDYRDSIQKKYDELLKSTPALKNPLDLATADALAATTRDEWRAGLQEALLKYAETIRISQYHEMIAQYGLIQLAYDQANDSREGAASMWNSLIADPINALAQYHAGGVKPETIADILSKFFIGSAILAK